MTPAQERRQFIARKLLASWPSARSVTVGDGGESWACARRGEPDEGEIDLFVSDGEARAILPRAYSPKG